VDKVFGIITDAKEWYLCNVHLINKYFVFISHFFLLYNGSRSQICVYLLSVINDHILYAHDKKFKVKLFFIIFL
jgi:hypothetical protein